MAIKQKSVLIGTDTFLINTFPAERSIVIFQKLLKLLGPAWLEGQKDDENAISNAIKVLFENLDQVDAAQLCKELCSSTYKGTMSIDFNSEFSGELDKLFKLLKEVVGFNYGNLFTLIAASPEFGAVETEQQVQP